MPGATYAAGGCGSTPLLLGSAPTWAASANPPPLRYALADQGEVAGFLFGYPMVAPASAADSDKVLWVVDSPRGGPLRVTGHPAGAAKPVVSSVWPPDSRARGDLPVADRGSFARLLAVHAGLARPLRHLRPPVYRPPLGRPTYIMFAAAGLSGASNILVACS